MRPQLHLHLILTHLHILTGSCFFSSPLSISTSILVSTQLLQQPSHPAAANPDHRLGLE